MGNKLSTKRKKSSLKNDSMMQPRDNPKNDTCVKEEDHTEQRDVLNELKTSQPSRQWPPSRSLSVRTKLRRHSFMCSASKFVVDSAYSPIQPLGTGAYGVVCSAIDTTTNKMVAIKKIKDVFESVVDAKRILREVKLLRHFSHSNVVLLTDLMVDKIDANSFDDLYMVFEFLETDLHKIIRSRNNMLTDEHLQYFVYQMLCGLKYIHSANVMHRDMKPSNLLLNRYCDLKICDFGLGRGVDNSEVPEEELTEYVVTRWYRAPEIMCSNQYNGQVDVWAVGCILAELLIRQPILPGANYLDQLDRIFELLGTPSLDDLSMVSNPDVIRQLQGLKHQLPGQLKRFLKQRAQMPVHRDCLDLIEKMLVFNPQKRITVNEALAHPYLSILHVPKEEFTHTQKFDFEFEADADTREGIRRMLIEEVRKFRPDLRTRADMRDTPISPRQNLKINVEMTTDKKMVTSTVSQPDSHLSQHSSSQN